MNIPKSMRNILKLGEKPWILIRNGYWVTTKVERKIEGKPGRKMPRTPFMKKPIEYTGLRTYKGAYQIINDREN